MKFLARSVGALCVLGGLLVGVYLLSLSRPGPVQAGCGPATVAEPAPVPRDTEQSIDQLMEHLRTLQAKKAELDRQEKEAITLLREKLQQQRQKLEKLGIAEDNTPPPSVVPASPAFSAPPPTGGPGESPVLPQSGSVTPPTPASPAPEVLPRASGPVFPVTPPAVAPEFPATPPAVAPGAPPVHAPWPTY